MTGYAPAGTIALVDETLQEMTAAGVILQTADDREYSGRYVDIDGARLSNFGGCSYLGLEQHPALKEAAIDAIHRFGTQFSYSRAYLESPLYARLERALAEMTGGYPLVAASTTLAHIAALPVLVRPGDAVILDQSAHASMHTAVGLLHSSQVVHGRHNAMDRIGRDVERLAAKHPRVWYLVDGLYSMFGDFAPLEAIAALLDRFPTLHLYVDDAHATSWTGKHGRGYALERLRDKSRTVVALSLNKAFSAAGAALIFPNPEMRGYVRRCGGPMIFSGPIQPPMLGAAVASAELHLSPALDELQRSLQERIRLVNALAGDLGIHFAVQSDSPIFFVPVGRLATTLRLCQALRERGFYTCPSAFPAVSREKAGIRFTVSVHNTEEDVRELMAILAEETKALGLARAPRTSRPPPPPPLERRPSENPT